MEGRFSSFKHINNNGSHLFMSVESTDGFDGEKVEQSDRLVLGS